MVGTSKEDAVSRKDGTSKGDVDWYCIGGGGGSFSHCDRTREECSRARVKSPTLDLVVLDAVAVAEPVNTDDVFLPANCSNFFPKRFSCFS